VEEKQLADLLGIHVKHAQNVAQSESDERKEANISVIKKAKKHTFSEDTHNKIKLEDTLSGVKQDVTEDKSLTESGKYEESDKYKVKSHKIKQKGEKFDRALCSVCSKSCRDKYVLKKHMIKHNPENLECDKCAHIFSSKVGLKQHMKTHNPENLVCDMCTNIFSSRSTLHTHIKFTHSETKHPCSFCGQLFSYNSISRHQKLCKMTEEEKNELKLNFKVECKDCGKVLANNTKLNRHIRFVHNNEKLYQCNVCDRQDYNKDNMKTHIKGIHKEKDPNTSFSNI